MSKPGIATFASVINTYLDSAKFRALEPSSQVSYRRYLCLAENPEALGSKPADQMRPRLVQAFLDGFLAGKSPRGPGAQQGAYTALKALEKWAAGPRELVPPFMLGVEIEGTDGGHHPWTEEEIEIAEIHARPDLARVVTLAAATGQRASDVVRMAWSDIEEHEGRLGIHVIQRKTRLKLWIPLTQHLVVVMASWERRPAPILLKANGEPWNSNHLAVAWKYERSHNPKIELCRDRVLHGLRASACVRARRKGASEAEISAIFGLSIPMVSRYCRLADQQKSAVAAVHYLDGTNGERTELKNMRPK